MIPILIFLVEFFKLTKTPFRKKRYIIGKRMSLHVLYIDGTKPKQPKIGCRFAYLKLLTWLVYLQEFL